MFRGPLLQLSTGLFPRQLALEHLGANGLALGTELFGESLLLRRRIGAERGAEPGTIAGGEAGAGSRAGTSTRSGAGSRGEARTGTGAHTSARAHAEAMMWAGGEAPALADEATALCHVHAASALTGEVAHLLLVLNTQRLAPGEVVDAGEGPDLQAALRESWYCSHGQSYGKTKELDGAHLRLPMSVGDWAAPFAQWTLGDCRC